MIGCEINNVIKVLKDANKEQVKRRNANNKQIFNNFVQTKNNKRRKK